MWTWLKGNSTREETARCLELILDGADYVWGDYTDIVQRDLELDALRLKILELETSHPPGPMDFYVNPAAQAIIRRYIRELRDGGNSWMLA